MSWSLSRRAIARLVASALAVGSLQAVAPVAVAAAGPAPLYLSSDNGGYAVDALKDPTAATTLRAPGGSRLVPQRPTGSETALAIYADGQVAGNVATPTFAVPNSSTVLTGVCVDVWLSKSGGSKLNEIALAVAFQDPVAGTTRSSTIKDGYTLGTVHRFTEYYTPLAPVKLSRGVSMFFTTFIDADQGLTIHYDSATYPSSVTVNADPAACGSGTSDPATGGNAVAKFDSATPPAPMGSLAGEPTVAVDWPTGAVQVQAGLETLRLANTLTGPVWSDVTPPLVTGRYTRDPFINTDHVTGRTWVSHLTAECTNLAFTDDVGGSWLEHPRGCAPLSALDHQSLASGPVPRGELVPVSQRALHLCGSQVVGGACARSDDGGVTFRPGREMYTIMECTSSHGQVRVGPTGVLAVPVRSCGGANTVAISTDGGGSFTLRPLPNSESAQESDPAVAFDEAGLLYVAYVDQRPDGSVLRLVSSSDNGASWTVAKDLGERFGLRNIQFPVMVAGDDGRAMLAFLGTQSAGDDQAESFTGVWHTYVALTVNGGTHWTLSNPDPTNIIQRGCINLGGVTATTCRNLLDFIGIDVDRTGAVVAAVADGCDSACEDGVATARTATVTVLRQRAGATLFRADRTTVPDQVFTRAAGRDGAVDVSWAAPADNGSAILGYHVYRSLAPGTATGIEVAALGASDRSYRDTDVRAGVTYYYSVAARNSLGHGRRLQATQAVPFVTDTVDGARGTIGNDGDATADGKDAATVSVTVRDRNGNPVNDHPVRLVVSGATVTPATARSGADGVASFAVKTTKAATYTARAYTDGTSVEVAPAGTARFVAGPVDRTRSVSTSSRVKAPADGATPIEVGVRLLDAFDNPVVGAEIGVRLQPGAAATADPATATTDATGYARVPVTDTVTEDLWAKPYLLSDGGDIGVARQLSFATLPETPPGVAVTPGNSQVRITWAAPPSGTAPTSYRVYRDGTFIASLAPWTFSFTDLWLTDWTTYGYEVASHTSYVGESVRSDIAYATPQPRPLTPQDFTATPGDDVVSLAWTEPSEGTIPTSYHVYRDDALLATLPAPAADYTDPAAANGTAYRYRVSAYAGEFGESAKTAELSATPLAAPAIPLDVVARAGNKAVSLSWVAPPSTTAAPVAGYRVYRDGVLAATTAATSATVTGLANHTEYSFEVTAYNDVAESGRSDLAVATPLPAPNPPSGLAASPANGTVTLAWQPPAGGTPYDGYRLYRNGVHVASPSSNAVSFVDSGRANGTAYTYELSAYAVDFGESLRSPGVTATPVAAPAAPASVTASPGNTVVSLSWPAAASPASAPVTGYRVYVDNVLRTTTSATAISVSGLANGTAYRFSVAAYNGTGESTRPFADATPVAPPVAASNLTGQPNDGTMALSWVAAASTASAPVSGYRVWAGGVLRATLTGTTHTVTGLTNGTSYLFEVASYNGSGESAKVTLVATPVKAPAAPASVTAAPSGPNQVTVSWAAVAATTASPLSGYRVYVDGALVSSPGASTTSLAVSSLTSGRAYRFAVATYNNAGESTRPYADATAIVPPAPASNLTGQPGDGQVALAWTAAPSTTSAPVTGYRVFVNNAYRTTVTATSYAVTGLANGTSYAFAVYATNGSGDATGVTASVTPVRVPDVPAGLAATPASGQVTVTWNAVVSSAASPVSGYRVYLDGTLRGTTTATSYLVGPLTDGQAYSFRVSAYNAAGESAQATAVTATPRPAPLAPTGFAATPANAQVSLSWTPPASGTAPTSYRVYRDNVLHASPATASYVDTAVTNGVAYSYSVSSYAGSYGESARTASVSATPVAPPGVPVTFSATAGDGVVNLSWAAPAAGAANPVNGYRVYVDGALSSTVTTTTHQVSGLTNGVARTFAVSAYNYAGESARTGSVTVTPNPPPLAPASMTATPADTAVTVSWTAAGSGTPPTHYRIYRDGALVVQVSSTASSYLDGSRTNGTSYSYYVTAYSTAYGESPATASVSVTPHGLPGQPTSLVPDDGDTTATVSWAAVASTPANPVTGYRVYRDGTLVETTTATSVTLSSLTNGTTYTVGVAAYNGVGESARPEVAVEPYTEWNAVATGNSGFTCGIATTNTTAKCWGSNGGSGWLGNGSQYGIFAAPQPVQTGPGAPLTGVTVLSHGGSGGACAIAGGFAYCWGNNDSGQLGDGSTATKLYATRVRNAANSGNLGTVTTLASGPNHRCAGNGSATVWCWGNNWNGQLGISSATSQRTYPVAVNLPLNTGAVVSELAATAYGTCARSSDYYVYCWGAGYVVGRNVMSGEYLPGARVYAPNTTTSSALGNVVRLDGGPAGLFCAMRSNGTSACWGMNGDGHAGDGTTNTLLVPSYVLNEAGTATMTGMSSVHVGYGHACYRAGTALYCSGDGAHGKLGTNSLTDRVLIGRVTGEGGVGFLADVASASAGSNHTCARTTDSHLYCWGWNSADQLGVADPTESLTPIRLRH